MQPPHNPWGQPPPQPYAHANPYAAPGPAMYRQNVFVPPGTVSEPLVKPTLRKLKLAAGIGQIVTMVVGIVFFVVGAIMSSDGGGDAGQVFMILGAVTFGFWYLLVFAAAIANMIWIYKFWSWIPPEQRHTNMWKKYISPGMAIVCMFIPYFNIYWMFVIYLGIADIMERLRVQYPSSKGPAKNLALVTLIVPIVFFPAGPFLQYMFAKHVEEMAAEMQARMPAPTPANMMGGQMGYAG
jgi:preprotein translocase subunit SecG